MGHEQQTNPALKADDEKGEEKGGHMLQRLLSQRILLIAKPVDRKLMELAGEVCQLRPAQPGRGTAERPGYRRRARGACPLAVASR